ncbi:PTI [Cordylochernes scorpioides]|uniref:PTI n=1 Tax=Cordylochernes scorpioides TaxID=51811 RepID=A0ABY6L3H3_9ARAC|nr:PTI [Cordylochernes scorpioides]
MGAAFIRPDYCLDAPAPGSCQATLPRYFYNATTGTCQTFLYSGCDCSRNNFRGLDDCLDVCKGWNNGDSLRDVGQTARVTVNKQAPAAPAANKGPEHGLVCYRPVGCFPLNML